MHGVVTLAGEGTRMLPWTRGLRKEFLPLYDRTAGGPPVLKPVAHLALETLVNAGVTDVTLVVSAKDREYVREYFSIDRGFLHRHARHPDRLGATRQLYATLETLRLGYAVQPSPRGFGDAVLRAEAEVGAHPFLLHAGDGILLERERGRLLRIMGALRLNEDLDAVLLVRRVSNPRQYGVVTGSADRAEHGVPRLRVTQIVEKPAKPTSSWAATAVYAFSSRLFAALKAVSRERRSPELELTDAIAHRIRDGGEVAALVLSPRQGAWYSVGSPEGFLRALSQTRRRAIPPGAGSR